MCAAQGVLQECTDSSGLSTSMIAAGRHTSTALHTAAELPLLPAHTRRACGTLPWVSTVVVWQGCLAPCRAMIHMAPPALCPGPLAWLSELLGKSFWRLQPAALRKMSSEPVFLKTQQLWITCPKLEREGTISAFQ